MLQELVHKLTEEQKKAICSPDGEFVVKAGAGTGKTYVLVRKYLSIYENKCSNGILPAEAANTILAVTFTRKTAKEIEKQLMNEYSSELKKLTITQGRILLKLIDRETGDTSYELLKELRGSISAFLIRSFRPSLYSPLRESNSGN